MVWKTNGLDSKSAGLRPLGVRLPLPALLAAEREANQQTLDRLQLVWTGPDVPGSVSRDTGVVMKELALALRYLFWTDGCISG
jgi:hypothetical protein